MLDPVNALRNWGLVGIGGLVAVLAGCGSSTPTITAPLGSPTSSMSTTTGPATITMSPTATVNLSVTNALRAELVAAGAKAKGLQASDFTGLRKGLTYYAFDPGTNTYWAGASLVPSSSSLPAQVSVQDDGAYTLFHRSANGGWVAMDSAMAAPNGPADASPCRVSPPATVLALWGWPAKSCHPNGG